MSEIEQHNADVQFMRECLTVELVRMLMAERRCSLEEAMGCLYNSTTFARLDNEKTLLYTQSPVYLHDMLQEELNAAGMEIS